MKSNKIYGGFHKIDQAVRCQINLIVWIKRH